MFFIAPFLLLSSVRAQFFPQQQQQQYPFNNYNSWLPYSQNYPVWNQVSQQYRTSVRGNLLSDDISALPFGSQITVSIVDVSLQDAPSRPLNTLVLYGSYRFPIAFDISYSPAQVQSNTNVRQYAIQARIEKDGQLLYINDQYTPVQLNPVSISPVNVYMKKVATSIDPNGYLTTQPPITYSINICQQIPDIGPCRASIQKFYFNVRSRSCHVFFWGGCGGNQNRFSTRQECERTCSYYRRRLTRNNSKQIPLK